MKFEGLNLARSLEELFVATASQEGKVHMASLSNLGVTTYEAFWARLDYYLSNQLSDLINRLQT